MGWFTKGIGFSDAQNVDIYLVDSQAKLVMDLDDVIKKQRFRLAFLRCWQIDMKYSDEHRIVAEEVDTSWICSPIGCGRSKYKGSKKYTIDLSDALLTIDCQEVSITEIPGYDVYKDKYQGPDVQ